MFHRFFTFSGNDDLGGLVLGQAAVGVVEVEDDDGHVALGVPDRADGEVAQEVFSCGGKKQQMKGIFRKSSRPFFIGLPEFWPLSMKVA